MLKATIVKDSSPGLGIASIPIHSLCQGRIDGQWRVWPLRLFGSISDEVLSMRCKGRAEQRGTDRIWGCSCREQTNVCRQLPQSSVQWKKWVSADFSVEKGNEVGASAHFFFFTDSPFSCLLLSE